MVSFLRLLGYTSATLAGLVVASDTISPSILLWPACQINNAINSTKIEYDSVRGSLGLLSSITKSHHQAAAGGNLSFTNLRVQRDEKACKEDESAFSLTASNVSMTVPRYQKPASSSSQQQQRQLVWSEVVATGLRGYVNVEVSKPSRMPDVLIERLLVEDAHVDVGVRGQQKKKSAHFFFHICNSRDISIFCASCLRQVTQPMTLCTSTSRALSICHFTFQTPLLTRY